MLDNVFKKISQIVVGNNNLQAGRDINILTNNIFTKMPEPDLSYIKRFDEKDIKNKIETTNILCIYGISGIGKTAISIAISNDIKDEFDNALFIKGEDLSVEFQKIIYNKMSYSENLEMILTKQKTLLVIDDLNSNIDKIFEKLNQMDIGDSRVIITAQTLKYLPEENSLPLHAPSEEVCKKILCDNLQTKISEDDLKFILGNVSSNPLILKMINRMLLNEDLDIGFLKKNINSIVSYEDIDRDITIARRLIGVIYSMYAKEVKALKWLNTTYCDILLLINMINKGPFDALKKRAIFDDLESINPYTVKIHDIILKAICYHVELTEIDEKEYSKQFIDYFSDIAETNEYFNALFMHKRRIQKLCGSNLKWGERLYLLLKCSYDSEIEFEKIDKLPITYNKNVKYEETQYFDYISIIEYFERKGLKIKSICSESYKKLLDFSIKIVNEFLENDTLDLKVRIDLTHHLGKFYLKHNDAESKQKAKKCFQNVLKQNSKYHASKLQLLRISLKEQDIDSAKKYIKEILDSYYFNKEQIDTTIVLATIQELRKRGLEEEFKTYVLDNFQSFKQLILNSSNFYFDHPFKTFVDIGKNLTYEYPHLYLEIAKNLPIKINDEIKDDNLLFSIGEYYKDLYKSEENKNQSILNEAEKYYININKPSDHQLRLFSQIYVLKNDTVTALNILDKITNKDDLFVQYEYSKIYSDMNKLKESLNFIDKAICIANDNKKFKKFKSMLYAQKGKVLYLLKELEWEEYYRKAIAFCISEKYINELREEYKKLLQDK